MELLEIKHVTKIYNTRLGLKQCIALSDVSFQVSRGEFVAVMGPSGSGKTSLLNILASLDKPTSGSVCLNGTDFSCISDKDISRFRRDNLGFVFQDFNLLDTFSIKDNILLPLVLANTPLALMNDKVKKIAEMLSISEILEKYPYEVSGGEKQRAAVARAIITEPQILLADEPTGALDSKASTNLLKMFSQLNSIGQTILMVTHNAVAASYANRVMFIKDGMLYNQIYRGNMSRNEFLEKTSNVITLLSEGDKEVEQ